MPGHKKSGGGNNKDDVLILYEKPKDRRASLPSSIKMETSSSPLSALDPALTSELVSVAEIAVRNHLKQMNAAKTKSFSLSNSEQGKSSISLHSRQ
jgi:hypothetical protein